MNQENQQQQAHKYNCDCGCMGLGPILKDFLTAVLPSENVSNHFRTAGVEFLKGVRTFVDEKIEHANRTQGPSQGTRVTVE